LNFTLSEFQNYGLLNCVNCNS